MNKRGDTPTILLILVAIVFAVATLIAMVGFSGGFDDWSRQLSEMMSEVEFAKQYVLETAGEVGKEAATDCEGCDIEGLREKVREVADGKNLNYYGAGNFFGRIRNGDFTLMEKGDGKVVFGVDGLFSQAKRERNEVKRKFDFEMELDFVLEDVGEIDR